MDKTLSSERHQNLIEFLIRQRKSLGMTQTDLANSIGEYQSFVARLESGQRRVDVVELLKLANVLEIDPHAILNELLATEN